MRPKSTLNIYLGLMLCFLIAGIFSCKKTTQPATCKHTHAVLLDSTCNISYTRVMYRYEHEVYATNYITYDTTDSVTVVFTAINNTSVMVGDDILTYNSSLSTDSFLFFEYSTNSDPDGEDVGANMQYYFKKDSIVYTAFNLDKHSDLTAVYRTY